MLPIEQLEPSTAVASAPNRFVHGSGAKPLAGYTIKRGLGHGGFGEVYYAISDAGKDVAIKLVRRNLDIELRGVTQCLNLKHPHLLALFDIKQDDQGDSWVIMEYIAGESLEQVLAKHPRGLPESELLRWFRGIALGVAYLHDHGVVHRDLKPGNIFDDQGIVKVGDYGLSKFISCSRRSGQTGSIGTVHYMAPEICNGRYGKEIDIYALGIMLYEMLTGVVPFEGESLGEILMKHLTVQPDLSRVAAPYRGVIARAMNKDPALRFHHVSEMLALLPGGAGLQLPMSTPAEGNPVPSVMAMPIQAHPVQSQPVSSELSNQALYYGTPTNQSSEPVARAVGQLVGSLKRSLFDTNMPDGLRIIVIIVMVLVAVATTGIWMPLLVMLLICYAIYIVIRSILLSFSGNNSSYIAQNYPAYAQPLQNPVANQPLPVAPLQPTLVPVQNTVPRPANWQRRAVVLTREQLIGSPRQRFTSLLGSMLLAPFVVLLLGTLMAITCLSDSDPRFNSLVWFMMMSVLGSWAMLGMGKWWESSAGEPVLRRLGMLGVGMIFGLSSYALATWLQVPLMMWREWNVVGDYQVFGNHYSDSLPIGMHVGYWMLTFGLLAWWYQADPLRSKRFSFLLTGLSVFAALLVCIVVPFAQPWGVAITGLMSVTTQLTALWIKPAARIDRGTGA